jgi:hypothetical protein
VARDEALHLELLVRELTRDVGEGLDRRLIVGRLEDAAEQYGHVIEPRGGTLLDDRQHAIARYAFGLPKSK